MKIHVEVIVNGQTFKGKSKDLSEDTTIEKQSYIFFENVNAMDKLIVELENGGWLILGNLAYKNAIITVMPD